MQFSDDLATRIIGTAFEALCFQVYSTSCRILTDGGSVGGSGHAGCGGSSGGVEAHACGAGGEAGGGAIGEADSGAGGGAEDRFRKSSCRRSNKMSNCLSNRASKLAICCLVKPAMVVRTKGLYEDRR